MGYSVSKQRVKTQGLSASVDFNSILVLIPCPGKLGGKLLALRPTIGICGTNRRDHDVGKKLKNVRLM